MDKGQPAEEHSASAGLLGLLATGCWATTIVGSSGSLWCDSGVGLRMRPMVTTMSMADQGIFEENSTKEKASKPCSTEYHGSLAEAA